MSTEVPYAVATTAAGTPGFGSSLAGLGTATKIFVLSHPVGLAVAGGALLGAGLYHLVTRKRGAPAEAQTAPAAAPAAA